LQEAEYAVSPSTPLLSTAIEENGWVCGQFARPCQARKPWSLPGVQCEAHKTVWSGGGCAARCDRALSTTSYSQRARGACGHTPTRRRPRLRASVRPVTASDAGGLMPHSQEGICWSASPPHVSALHSSLARLAHFAEGAQRSEAGGRHDTVSPGACGRRPSAQLAGAQARTRMGSWALAGPRTCQSRRCCRCGAARSVKLGAWSPCGGAGGCAGAEEGSPAGRGAPQELQVPRASLLHLPRASALCAFPPSTASYRATPTQQR